MLRSFPFIDQEEFEQACCELEKRSYDKLDGTMWLGVQWHNDELRIRQARRENSRSDADVRNDHQVLEDDDEEVLQRHSSQTLHQDSLQFCIRLSPSYSVPVLWFSISSTRCACVNDLEEVYSQIVSPTASKALHGVGVMGGISIANHPVTDIPMFFIHPCNTSDALLAVNPDSQLDPCQYLMLWLGIVGSAVGLHVPLRVAVDFEKGQTA